MSAEQAGMPGPQPDGSLRHLQQLIASGDHASALAAAREEVVAAPVSAEAHSLLAYLLLHNGDTPGAVEAAAKACGLAPGSAALLVNLARAEIVAGDYDSALGHLDSAQVLSPGWSEPAISASEACIERGFYHAAVSRCNSALERFPGDLDLTWTCANALHYMGHNEEAVALLTTLLPRHPTDVRLASTLAHFWNYIPGATPAQVFDTHRKFGKIVARHYPSSTTKAAPRPLPAGARLRLGLISPDFREHSVAFFVEPLLAHLDRAGFEVFAYSTKRSPDATASRLRSLADHWRELAGAREEAAAATIRADNLDVLIELAGHTKGHSLMALRYRPAHRQATWLGYPNTTGLAPIDARLVDAHTDPAPAADALATEKLVRLQTCFLCYQAAPNQPDPGQPPSAKNRFITFGSFNTLKKLNGPLLELWATVLKQVPDSRLLLKAKGLEEPALREELAGRFAGLGITADRLELIPPIKDSAAHRAAYARVDIALDAFPYHGTTTTCEALWMGVPVVTLAGAMHAGRVGASLLTAVGVPDLIASSTDEFVRIAAALAADQARLAHLRATLRPQMSASALCDASAFARRFEQAVHALAES